MEFILANWRIILLAALIASSALFFKLWRGEVADFTAYKIEVAALGKAAEMEKQRIEADHNQITQEIKDAIPKKIAAARTGAVAAYRLRYPDSGSGDVSCPAVNSSGVPATVKEPVVAGWTGAADPTFIEVCAEDAQIRGLVGEWARGIGFPIK